MSSGQELVRSIVKVSLSNLFEDPSNARSHDEKNLSAIKGSLLKFGQQHPIIIDKNNVILAGNGRFRAAKELGWTSMDCIVTDLDSSTDKTAFALADNRTSELATWDTDILSDTLKALDEDGFDVTAIGFDLPEVLEPVTPGCDEDDVPEDVVTRSKPGDIWKLGNHRIMCGDSTNIQHVEKLMEGEKADMVFTDPPFPNNSKILHDMIDGIDSAFQIAQTVCDGNQLWFWDNISSPPFGEVTARHVWHKTNGWQAGHWESMNVFHADKKRHESVVFSYPNVGQDGELREIQGNHPTPKPSALLLAVFEFTKAGNKVLDLFLGSGATLIACEKTKRKCYGMEIDPKYVDVILARWEKYTGKTAELLNKEV